MNTAANPVADSAVTAAVTTRTWRQMGWLVVYDLRQQWRERGTRALLAVALLLAGLALWQGENFRRGKAAAIEQAAAQQAAAVKAAEAEAAAFFANPGDPRWDNLRSWRSAFDLRGYVFREHLGFAAKPLLPGAAFAIGQADVLPSVVRVKAESMDSVRQSADIVHPARLAAGRFDMHFFVVCLWPLVLLAGTLSVLTQERENLRLPALSLLGVSPRQVLLAQAVARVLAASAVLVVVMGLLALLIGALPFSAAGLAAWAAWAALATVYSLFWAAVAALVCARASNRSTAAFAGFGAWVGIVVLLPALLSAAVSLAAPQPSREAYIVAVRDATDQVQANRASVVSRFYDQHPEWKPERTALDKLPAAVTRLARAAELERAMAGVDARFEQARQRQARLLQVFSFVSPVSLTHEALSTLAGSSAARHQQFVAEVQLHQRQLRDFFQARIQRAALNDERQPCPVVGATPNAGTCLGSYGFQDFNAVPRYQAGPSLNAAPAGALAAGAVIAAWALALLALAAWWVRRPAGKRSPVPQVSAAGVRNT